MSETSRRARPELHLFVDRLRVRLGYEPLYFRGPCPVDAVRFYIAPPDYAPRLFRRPPCR